MIDGVVVKQLKTLTDDRGFLMEMLRADEPIFEQFGQVYVTGCRRGVVKGWHYHKKQTDHFVCLLGRALVVLYDPRDGSPTKGVVKEYYLDSPPGTEANPPILLKKFLPRSITASRRQAARRRGSSMCQRCPIDTSNRMNTAARGTAERFPTGGQRRCRAVDNR